MVNTAADDEPLDAVADKPLNGANKEDNRSGYVREGGSVAGFSIVVVCRLRRRFAGECERRLRRRRRLLASSSALGLGFVVDRRICHIVSRLVQD
nr:hypothetical protein Iba_chr09fCG9310 [Ipomoea batatas]